MRQRLMLMTLLYNSVMQSEYPSLFLFAQASVSMRTGRWSMLLILKHGNGTPQDFQASFGNMGSKTNGQPISPPYSVHRAPITANMQRQPRSQLWISRGTYLINSGNWEDF